MEVVRNLVYKALLVAMALALHLIERNIPVPFMTPGAKLGLSNLVTVIALYSMPCKKDIGLVISVRLILSSIFGGSLSSLLYSSSGAFLSFGMMLFVQKLLGEKVSIIGVSVVGAFFHNIGQIIVACIIVKNIGVFLYLPFLCLIGIITGTFIGLSSYYILPYIKRLPHTPISS